MGDEYTGFLTVENYRKPYTRKSNARRGQERATPRKVPMKREPYEYRSSESKDGRLDPLLSAGSSLATVRLPYIESNSSFYTKYR
jgi:hypothetical protein